MENINGLERLTQMVANFTSLISKKLPDDVSAKLKELKDGEKNPMASMIYEAMENNQKIALELSRPSCQDTGLVQMFVRVGTSFPYINELKEVLKNAVAKATKEAPLRHNTVETFDEVNTGTNVGTESPWTYWEIIPNSDKLELDVYLAGGGCSLPGSGKTLMPGEGYEGVSKFVLDLMTSYGLNACPPLLVGVGIGTSIDSASFMAKKALMRKVGSKNENEKAHQLELDLEKAINYIGLGPQGLRGTKSVMGVNIENSARHPSVLSVAVNIGCWSHRRGTIRINPDLTYENITHEGARL